MDEVYLNAWVVGGVWSLDSNVTVHTAWADCTVPTILGSQCCTSLCASLCIQHFVKSQTAAGMEGKINWVRPFIVLQRVAGVWRRGNICWRIPAGSHAGPGQPLVNPTSWECKKGSCCNNAVHRLSERGQNNQASEQESRCTHSNRHIRRQWRSSDVCLDSVVLLTDVCLHSVVLLTDVCLHSVVLLTDVCLHSVMLQTFLSQVPSQKRGPVCQSRLHRLVPISVFGVAGRT